MFPLFVNLVGRRCLVVGGGAVGRRRATALLQAEADVRLVCLEPPQRLEAPRQPEWLQEPYRPEHLADVALVFAAATRRVNRQVAADAKAHGLWVNVADDPHRSDFQVPACIRQGDFTLAISTGGAAPGLAKQVRERLQGDYDAAFGDWVALLAELRPLIQLVAEPAQRQTLTARLTDWNWLDRLRSEGVAVVRQAMLAELSRHQVAAST